MIADRHARARERYKKEDPIQRERRKQKCLEYRIATSEERKEYSRVYREANREAILRKSAAWRKANPEKLAAGTKRCYGAKKDQYLKAAAKWRAANPERVKANVAAYQKNHKEECREKLKRWKANHREQVLREGREYMRKRYLADPEAARAKSLAWAKANPGKKREQNQKRYKMATSGECYTLRDVERILNSQNGKCANPYCSKILTEHFHVDHIIPLARSGSNAASNIQILCVSCNLKKSRKTMEEFIAIQEKQK